MHGLPRGYKVLEGEGWNIPGKLAGSAVPGGYSYDEDSAIEALQSGETPEQAVNPELLSNFDALYKAGIRTIYSLLAPPSELAKLLWESDRFAGTEYTTVIKGVKTAIEDFGPPTQTQLQLITDDAIEKMQKGEGVLVHCQGGMGRTGTILSAIYMQGHEQYDAKEAIKYIRKHYSGRAVESRSQEESLRIFGNNLQKQKNASAAEMNSTPQSFVEKETNKGAIKPSVVQCSI